MEIIKNYFVQSLLGTVRFWLNAENNCSWFNLHFIQAETPLQLKFAFILGVCSVHPLHMSSPHVSLLLKGKF